MKLCDHWGFRYANCLVWNPDVLNEVSENGEILLVYVKGSPKLIFDTSKTSEQKPAMVKVIIEKGYPGWSKVEMFVGKEIEGWEVW
jgi:N6-adenosine-specific RNA methylase IME4